MSSSPSLPYRPDIDGLRALAVLPVILFHAGFNGIPGGFIGVDVFFVISGYLISSILLKELQQGRFSLLHFYERRARRILPALLLVLLCCLPLALLLLLPDELRRFGQSLAAVALFGSNFYFWSTTGYFEPAAETLPLLHSWSLAVEEQFYIVLPLALAAGWRWQRARLLHWTLGLALVSLGLAQWSSQLHPQAGFFLPHTRAWELLAGTALAVSPTGALAALQQRRWVRELVAAAGMLALVLAALSFDYRTPTPSLFTLLPVLGTVALLACAEQTWVGRLLAIRPMVAVGLISYGAYLWHQPLFAFARIAYLGQAPQPVMLGLALLSLLLATLTLQLVERPLRHASRGQRRPGPAAAALALLVPLCLGLGVQQAEGFPGRMPTHYLQRGWDAIQGKNYGLNPACEYQQAFSPKPDCVHGARPNTLLWGDSFAMHLASALVEAEVSFVQATRSACSPNAFLVPHPDAGEYNHHWSQQCLAFNQSVVDYLKAMPEIHYVVMASPFWPYMAEPLFDGQQVQQLALAERIASFVRTAQLLKALGKEPLLVMPPPINGRNIGDCLKRLDAGIFTLDDGVKRGCKFELAAFAELNDDVHEFVAAIAAQAGVRLVRLDEYICPAGHCDPLPLGVPLYRDFAHLSNPGARQLARRFGMFDSMASSPAR
ncbi:acyltransferase family protein [Paucibacter sp. APW11]|uniref:Acyltransferase family protein n=1 Tax=Roseateles aquae TaxID=3077235 RepID=A0ABU3PC07_9BURK|nr:acyltransferase family protein [Paucibacter sp. APW11]MDT9000101.1 acyltransferase family protein [Paucibacter sp. APW11]